MGAALPILMAGQTMMKIAANNQQAHQIRDMYNDKAKMERANAANAQLQASQAADKSAKEEKKILDKARAAAAANNASAGASGLLAQGSLNDVNNASNDEAIYDLKQSLADQRITTQNYRVSEGYSRINAERYRAAGRNVVQQAHMQNFATILGAAAQAYSMYGGSSNNNTSTTAPTGDWTFGAATEGRNPWGLNNPMSSKTFGIDNWAYQGVKPRNGYTAYSWGR